MSKDLRKRRPDRDSIKPYSRSSDDTRNRHRESLHERGNNADRHSRDMQSKPSSSLRPLRRSCSKKQVNKRKSTDRRERRSKALRAAAAKRSSTLSLTPTHPVTIATKLSSPAEGVEVVYTNNPSEVEKWIRRNVHSKASAIGFDIGFESCLESAEDGEAGWEASIQTMQLAVKDSCLVIHLCHMQSGALPSSLRELLWNKALVKALSVLEKDQDARLAKARVPSKYNLTLRNVAWVFWSGIELDQHGGSNSLGKLEEFPLGYDDIFCLAIYPLMALSLFQNENSELREHGDSEEQLARGTPGTAKSKNAAVPVKTERDDTGGQGGAEQKSPFPFNAAKGIKQEQGARKARKLKCPVKNCSRRAAMATECERCGARFENGGISKNHKKKCKKKIEELKRWRTRRALLL